MPTKRRSSMKRAAWMAAGSVLNPHFNVGSSKPALPQEMLGNEYKVMVQKSPIFKHCHHVCIDKHENINVRQWNADQTYAIKLECI